MTSIIEDQKEISSYNSETKSINFFQKKKKLQMEWNITISYITIVIISHGPWLSWEAEN